ncbi:MAG: 5-(carboxyamino)imidazole ribonucleotide synthase [Gammaproteobacteria bacterium]|nr:5-(carboxyamino)imidazole ribonucleotide synthase [Gammaproteobacteria bacterium]
MPRTIGVIGGGQLAAMLTTEATAGGVDVIALDPTPRCPAAVAGARQIVSSVFDETALRTLVQSVDITTVELENVHLDLLHQLELEGHTIVPAPAVIAVIADKLAQKEVFAKQGIATAAFSPMPTPAASEVRAFGFPCVQKAARGGYDGRGVTVMRDETELVNLLPVPGFLEAFVPNATELGVMVARSRCGEEAVYPVTEMVFNGAGNMLDYLLAPARIPGAVERAAKDLALQAVRAVNGTGIFGVEMFLTHTGQLLVNEMAPRTHNCGHFTIDACATSQFAQQLRLLTGTPLGSPSQHRAAAMINLLGAAGYAGAARIYGVDKARTAGPVNIYLYGKHECRPLRKMGHLTALGATVDEALADARKASQAIIIRGEQVC